MLYYVLHESTFIPVDEVETSIHYELLSYFIKLFLANSECTSQLLMTTHDINLLNEDFVLLAPCVPTIRYFHYLCAANNKQ